MFSLYGLHLSRKSGQSNQDGQDKIDTTRRTKKARERTSNQQSVETEITIVKRTNTGGRI